VRSGHQGIGSLITGRSAEWLVGHSSHWGAEFKLELTPDFQPLQRVSLPLIAIDCHWLCSTLKNDCAQAGCLATSRSLSLPRRSVRNHDAAAELGGSAEQGRSMTRSPVEALHIKNDRLAAVPPVDMAYRLYYTVMPEPLTPAEATCLEQAERGRTELGKYGIATYRWGDAGAPAVVFMHGWNGNAAQVADFVPVLLEAGLSVVAFDGPGHGKSDGKTTNVVQLGAALCEVCKPLQRIRGLIGHSLGAMVVSYAIQEYASLFNERAPDLRCVLVSPPYSFDHMSKGFMRITGVDQAVMDEIIRRSEAHTGKGWYEVSGEQLLPKQTARALIVHDFEDTQIPFAQGKRVHAHWARSTLYATRGLGHRKILADRDVCDQVQRFMSGQGAS
jgi:hypothetical protein